MKTHTEPWPVISGYDIDTSFDPESPVAVVCLSGRIKGLNGAALAGPLVTENVGIERIIVNCISNTAIQGIVVAGPEVKGHYAGQSLIACHTHGIEKNGRIVGAKGALPYIQNLNTQEIDRFRNQIAIVKDMIGVEDPAQINNAITEVRDFVGGLSPYPDEPYHFKKRIR